MNNSILFILLLFFATQLNAQADAIDDVSKINSVIAVVAVILIGMAAFLFFLERRLKKLEDKLNL